MGLLEDAVARYRREYDFYDHAARLVAQILDTNLQSAGIRAIVTARAKSPNRLAIKIKQRASSKNYKSVETIYDDIIDLAGVRVALYFPAERDQVGKLIKSLFVLVSDPKKFPSAGPPSYEKRFSGYWATHYRVRIPEAALNEAQKRYAEARVEIQVASVLMHAWSEVEHDLVYKPFQGRLSEEEYAILDELNGLVMAGEIALERLQRAGKNRVAVRDRQFANHYDLAAYLLDQARTRLKGADLSDSALGRVDTLFQLLQSTTLNTPEKLDPLLAFLHADLEKRPISEQVIDQLLAQDPKRYDLLNELRGIGESAGDDDIGRPEEHHVAVGQFINEWIRFETLVRDAAVKASIASPTMWPSHRLIEELQILDPGSRQIVERIRRFRNNLVHGLEVPSAEVIQEATVALHGILKKLGTTPKVRRKRSRSSVKKPR